MAELIKPHGGVLKNLYLTGDNAEAEKRKAVDYPSWDLTERQLCDAELLLNGAFSPLEGFLNEQDYRKVADAWALYDNSGEEPILIEWGEAP